VLAIRGDDFADSRLDRSGQALRMSSPVESGEVSVGTRAAAVRSPRVRLLRALDDPVVYPLGAEATITVVVATCLAGFIASLNAQITATAGPAIVRDLGGLQHYSWVSTGYLLASVVTIPLFGMLSDIYGRRGLFLAAILIFSTGSLIAALAPSFGVLVGGRVVQGVGAGGLGPLALAVMGDLIAPRARGRWQAVTGLGVVTAAVCGPLIGGWVTVHLSWRYAFLVSLPLAVAALAAVWFKLPPRTTRHDRKVDYTGAALLAVGATLALVLLSSRELSLDSLAPAAASAAFLAAFVAHERRVHDPMLPIRLLKRRSIAAANVALAMVGASMLGTITYVPLLVQNVIGLPPTSVGRVLIPLTLAWIAGTVIAGQIVSRVGRSRPILLAGPPITALGFLLLSRANAGSSIDSVGLAAVCVGLGLGLMVQTLIVFVQNEATASEVGSTTASAEFSRWAGAVTGVALMGTALSSRIGSAEHNVPPERLAAGLHVAFLVGLVFAATAQLSVFLLRDRGLRNEVQNTI
jgi:EmrB/QacA subfamily drug resistance transporter